MRKWVGLGAMLLVGLMMSGVARAAQFGPFTIVYSPTTKLVQSVPGADGGLYPSETYELLLTAGIPLQSIFQLTNTPLSALTMGFTVLNKPQGVSDADALSFISASPFHFDAQGRLATNITVSVPPGTQAGNFAWNVKPLSWPLAINVGTDLGGTVNAVVTGPPTPPAPPVVTIQTPYDGEDFIYNPITNTPAQVPIAFTATVTSGAIDSLLANMDGTPLSFTPVDLGTTAASGSLTQLLTSTGPKTITVTATNGATSSSRSVHINIKSPPVITSADHATFAAGLPGTFTVTGTGYPAPTFSLTGTLPPGVSFDASTGILSGTPTSNAGSPYLLTITATNGVNPAFVQNFSLTVTKSQPVITWAAPAAIVYGTPLSGTQLNAVAAVGGTQVPGTYTYSPAAGMILNAGASQTLNVTFTPDDAITYNGAIGSTSITVLKATPTINWAQPAAINYGTALSATQLNATATFGGNPVNGTLTYAPGAGTLLNAGPNQALSVLFVPADTTNFTNATGGTTITVLKVTPVITWPAPAGIVYGTALSATQLNATAAFNGNPVSGTFTYSPAAGTILNAGAAQTLSVGFTPSDTTNYNGAAATTAIDVAKATPVISWTAPAAITYPTALSATQLNATAAFAGNPVAGTFAYTPAAGTVLNAGPNQALNVAFTPSSNNYNNATGSTTITVLKATPTIAWATPASITYGTALSATQLNATVTLGGNAVAGALTYSPAAGAVLNVGANQTLNVTFAPTDTTNINGATGSTTITVTQATPVITWPNPASIVYGTLLSSTQLNATANVPGTFVYAPATGALLNAGNQTLSVTFTPTDSVTYKTLVTTRPLLVQKANQIITFNALPTKTVGDAPFTISATVDTNNPITFSSATTSVATVSGTTVTVVGAGTSVITASVAETANYYAASATQTLTVQAGGVAAGTALVRHSITLNGLAGIDGSIQVLLPEGDTLNGNAFISGSLLVPGTPNIVANGHPCYTVADGTGSASPTNYNVTLNGNALIGKIVRHTDAIQMPVVAPPPSPTGTRSVTLNSSKDSIGTWSTVKNLTLNGNNLGTVTVPAGTYGNFIANGNKNAFKLGTAGSTTPAVYNFQNLTLNGNSQLIIAGPVVITLANGVAFNGDVGTSGHPEWLTLKIASGGLTLNGNIDFYGFVVAPNGSVILNGNDNLVGGVVCDRLTINGNGLLDLTP